jgi:hypothetical protein
MKLAFEATFVDCGDAIGGEILQLSFDTIPSNLDADQRRTPYVLISRNFEFPDSATVECTMARIMTAVLKSGP